MSLLRLRQVDTSAPQWPVLLKDLLQKILETGKVKTVLVFGSFANGQMSEASDLDIAVILADSEDPRAFRKKLPTPLTTWPLDLVIVTHSQFLQRKDFGGVLMEVSQLGVELYPNWTLGDKK